MRKLFPKADPDAPKVPYLQKMIGLFFALVMIWVLFGRGSPIADKDGGELGTIASSNANMPMTVPKPRVASLSPAITDSLVALGLQAHIVGRSGYCRSVDASIAVVGDLREFDAERLALVAPDVLFVQPPLAGVDPALREYCDAKHIMLRARRIDSIADLSALVDDIELAFDSADASTKTTLAIALSRYRALLAPPPPLEANAPRVLLVVSVDPFLAIGRGGYLDELLTAAGLANVLDRPGYLELSTEQLLLLSPDAILGVSETAAGAAKIDAAMGRLPWSNGAPKINSRALPALLSPSLAALDARDELARLAAGAK